MKKNNFFLIALTALFGNLFFTKLQVHCFFLNNALKKQTISHKSVTKGTICLHYFLIAPNPYHFTVHLVNIELFINIIQSWYGDFTLSTVSKLAAHHLHICLLHSHFIILKSF